MLSNKPTAKNICFFAAGQLKINPWFNSPRSMSQWYFTFRHHDCKISCEYWKFATVLIIDIISEMLSLVAKIVFVLVLLSMVPSEPGKLAMVTVEPTGPPTTLNWAEVKIRFVTCGHRSLFGCEKYQKLFSSPFNRNTIRGFASFAIESQVILVFFSFVDCRFIDMSDVYSGGKRK